MTCACVYHRQFMQHEIHMKHFMHAWSWQWMACDQICIASCWSVSGMNAFQHHVVAQIADATDTLYPCLVRNNSFAMTSGQPVLHTNVSGGRRSPRINRGDHLFMWKWKLTVDCLCVDHQCAPPPQDQQRWSPFTQKWKLTVDHLCIDCQYPPTRSMEAIAFSHESESRLLITSVSIIDPPGSTLLIASVSIVDYLSVHCRSTPLHF